MRMGLQRLDRLVPAPPRSGSRKLQALTAEDRADVMRHLADSLLSHQDVIMEANMLDLEAARQAGITGPMYSRWAIVTIARQCILNTINWAIYEHVFCINKDSAF